MDIILVSFKGVEQVDQLAAVAGIQVAAGLVKGEDFRLHRKDGGDGGPLFLPDAHVVRGTLFEAKHVHLGQGAGTLPGPLLPGIPIFTGPKPTSSDTVGMNS